eukprot:scaffold15311_cov136-Cylindrotheca_fusiformis.AAC.13
MTSPTTKKSERSSTQNIDLMILQARASQKGKDRRTLLGPTKCGSKRLMMKKQKSGFLKCCECNRTIFWGGFAKSQRTKNDGCTTCRSCQKASAQKGEEKKK